jgi:hypothetical protein
MHHEVGEQLQALLIGSSINLLLYKMAMSFDRL